MTTRKIPKKRTSSAHARPKRAVPAAKKGAASSAAADIAQAAPAGAQAVEARVEIEAAVPTAAVGISIQLESGLEIKDAERVHGLLLTALGHNQAITVDVARVQVVDTAGAQLLLAFQIEAGRRGLKVEFRGESAPLTHTLAVLGLRDRVSLTVSHG